MMKRYSATASSIAIRSKGDWPPEVASMLDVLRIVAPRVGDAGGLFGGGGGLFWSCS